MPKKKNSKKPKTDPTNFPETELLFLPRVASLSAIDKSEAEAAYAKLARRVYQYVAALVRRDAVDELCTHLMRRDRTAAILDMNEYQLALQLAMPGKFPPLNASMRKALGIKLAYAKKQEVAPEDVGTFIKKLPPMKEIKAELGLTTKAKEPTVTLVRRPKPRRRPQFFPKRSRTPPPVANSTAAKLKKANGRKNARSKHPTADE